MRYVSLFSGIGGFDLGFDRAGMTCVGQVENNPQALKVLEKHWPEVPKWRDIRDVGQHNLPAAALYCGGFPCQDVSVAGRREGLAGARSGLWFEFHRVLKETTPEWVVIENVPGLLSSNGGRDFATVLQGLVECGYRVCWRILDSQYFGVPQRRRRVFIVGHIRDGRSAHVLFEPDRGAGDSTQGRQTRKELARDLAASLRARGAGTGTRIDNETGLVVAGTLGAAHGRNRALGNANETDLLVFNQQAVGIHEQSTRVQTLTARDHKSPNTLITAMNINGENLSPTLTSEGADSSEDGRNRHAFAFHWNASASANLAVGETSPTIKGTANNQPAVMLSGVRRLTPTECKRLQGFSDGHTAGRSDSVRYRQLGNAVTVNVAEWLGRRICAVQTPLRVE